MREIRSNQIKEVIKKSKQSVLISFIVILCGVAICFLSFYMKDFRKSTSLYEFLSNNETAEDTLVHIDVNRIPDMFVSDRYDDTGNFYFLSDGTYVYIAFLSDEMFNELNVESISEKPITVKGFTKKIPSDIKKIILEIYNKGVKKEEQVSYADLI